MTQNEEQKLVSAEDLNTLQTIKNSITILQLRAEKTALEVRYAQKEYENILLKIYMKYGMESTDSINESTGEILREGAQESTEQPKEVEKDDERTESKDD